MFQCHVQHEDNLIFISEDAAVWEHICQPMRQVGSRMDGIIAFLAENGHTLKGVIDMPVIIVERITNLVSGVCFSINHAFKKDGQDVRCITDQEHTLLQRQRNIFRKIFQKFVVPFSDRGSDLINTDPSHINPLDSQVHI